MKIVALIENFLYSPEEDQSVYKIQDTRKYNFTLKKLNKLKKIRELKKFEILKDNLFIELMYGAAPEEEAGGTGF